LAQYNLCENIAIFSKMF